MGEGVGSEIGAGLQAGELGQGVMGHGQTKMQRRALTALRKRDSANWGKFVQNWYEFRANFTVS